MITNLKERWFVLTPKSLKYYTSQDEKDLKGDIKITEAVKIEVGTCIVGKNIFHFSLKNIYIKIWYKHISYINIKEG